MRLERSEVVFSRTALVGAEGDTCLVQLGERFGDGLDASIVEYLVRRGIQRDVDVDSEKDFLVSRFYVVESQEIIFFQLRGPSSTSRPGLGFCLMICNELLGLQTHADLRRGLVSSDAIRRFMVP